jgi:hypothetical protein
MNNKVEKLLFGTDEVNKSFDKNMRISEGIGALKVINAIQDKYRTSLGEIYVNSDEWTKFITPYTEVPK